jgi:two-component system, OmpR family, sensor histidine kinase KdpD
MHEQARLPFAATSSLQRAEGAGAARATDRPDPAARRSRGMSAAPGRDTERRQAAQPALPPPMGDAGRGDRQGGGESARTAAAGEPDPMRVIEILSHELRSPITTIHLGTKVLREQGHRISQPVRIEVVEAVEEEAERLYRLVEDLLAVARHEGGGAPLPVGPIALQHWLSSVIGAEVQASPSLRVRLSIPPDLPPVLADDAALAHVLRNLLANVTRYAPEGMPAEIVAWPNDDGTIRLEVLDRGPGVEADETETVFEPFYRSSSAKAIGTGAGLGLAAAQRLMRAMGGSIVVLPRAGGGARFVLTLPVAMGDADLEEDALGADPDPEVRRAS